MIWCTVCSMRRSGKVESTDVIGPFDDAEEMQDRVAERVSEIRSEGLMACAVPFELCSDDVPEVLHELTC